MFTGHAEGTNFTATGKVEMAHAKNVMLTRAKIFGKSGLSVRIQLHVEVRTK